MINFAIPGIDQHFHIIQHLINIKNNFPDFFYPDININAFYGNFQYCIWDGGRIFNHYQNKTSNEVYEIRQFINSYNIPVRLIFTNPILEKKHLNDRFCNLVTEICESELNEIVVNSPLLEEYLRKNYPKYNFISSTTKCNKAENTLQELNSDYKYICLDYNLNKNSQLLKAIPDEKRNKIEFLINAICPPGCPNRKTHYKLNGCAHLNLMKTYNIDCRVKENTVSNTAINYHNNISIQEIRENYIPNNYTYFKLEGRTLPDLEIIENLSRYLIKPEHQLNFILHFNQVL